MTTAHTSTLPAEQALEFARSGRILVAGAGVAGRGVLSLILAVRDNQPKEHQQGAAAQKTAGGAVYAADDRVDALDSFPGVAAVTQVDIVTAQDLVNQPGALDLVITSPGWPPHNALLQAAVAAGIPTIGDIEFAWLLDQAAIAGPSRIWIAITGTNGKTTTTAMTEAMCHAAGLRAEAVGNIGQSPATALARDLVSGDYTQVLVAEVSSFQLHWSASFTPDVGCVLNIAEDHLDWHGSLEGYAEDKGRVLKAKTPIIAVDDHRVLGLSGAQQLREGARAFSATEVTPAILGENNAWPQELESLVAVHRGRISLIGRDSSVLDLAPTEGISPPGPAGVADAAAAAAMSLAIGVQPEHIAAALGSFEVDAHRGQVVCESDSGQQGARQDACHRVQWIDNSKATNPHAAAAALRGQTGVVWVAGGQLKGASVAELIAEVGAGFVAVVALGTDRQIILDEMARQYPDVPVYNIENTDPVAAMRQAVEFAQQAIQQASAQIPERGDSTVYKVVLAPAAASLDMYTGMSQRGDLFAQLAREVIAQEHRSVTSGPELAGK